MTEQQEDLSTEQQEDLSIEQVIDLNAFLEYKRNKRNSYLQLTDKYILPDFPITEEKRNIIIEYRQMLRDFINNNQEAILNGLEVEIPPIPI